jgi:hypothetical protein
MRTQGLSSHYQLAPVLATSLSSFFVRATRLNGTVSSFIGALLVSCELWELRSRLNLVGPTAEKTIRRRHLDTARLSRVCCSEIWKKLGSASRDTTGFSLRPREALEPPRFPGASLLLVRGYLYGIHIS